MVLKSLQALLLKLLAKIAYTALPGTHLNSLPKFTDPKGIPKHFGEPYKQQISWYHFVYICLAEAQLIVGFDCCSTGVN